MITKTDVLIMRALVTNQQDTHMCGIPIGAGAQGVKINAFARLFLKYYQLIYSADHKSDVQYIGKHEGVIGQGKFVHIMCKYFGEQEPWIFTEGHVEKEKFNTDPLYALKALKNIFGGYTDLKVKNQSDTLLALVGWSLARRRETEDGVETKGFIDYVETNEKLDPEILDVTTLGKVELRKIPYHPENVDIVSAIPPLIEVDSEDSLEDLFEESESEDLPLPIEKGKIIFGRDTRFGCNK